MQIYRRAELGGGFPEWVQVGVVEITVAALGLGADHSAGEPGGERLAQHFRRQHAVL